MKIYFNLERRQFGVTFIKQFISECVCVFSPSVCIQSLTLFSPMDCSLPGYSVHGISQARILEWVAISFFRASSQPRDQTRSPTLWADALPSEPQGKPISKVIIYYYSYLKLCSVFHIVYTLILFFIVHNLQYGRLWIIYLPFAKYV